MGDVRVRVAPLIEHRLSELLRAGRLVISRTSTASPLKTGATPVAQSRRGCAARRKWRTTLALTSAWRAMMPIVAKADIQEKTTA